MSDHIAAAALVRHVHEQARRLVAEQGWTLTSHLTGAILASPEAERHGHDLTECLVDLAPCEVSARLTAVAGSSTFSLERYGSSSWRMAEDRAFGDLNDDFPDYAVARRAAQGDAEAALALAARWSATVEIDLARPLAVSAPHLRWVVVQDSPEALEFLKSQRWWTLDTLTSPTPAIIVVADAPDSLRVRAGKLGFMSLAAVAAELDLRVAATPALVVRRSRELPKMPSPDAIYPVDVSADNAAGTLSEVLLAYASACAWAELATSAEVVGDVVCAEYFGLMRQSWTIPKAGLRLSHDQHSAVRELWRSAAAASPDRVLAARQVVSLYPAEPWARAADVIDASDPIFVALRADAIAEAMRTQREARSTAQAIVRQSADAAAGLAKGAVERVIAVLAAIGAIVVGVTSDNLTAGQAENLRQLLAVFLMFLAAWSLLVEGALVTGPLAGLDDEVDALGDLLSDAQRKELKRSEVVKRTRRQAWIVRGTVPIAYLVVAALALTVEG